MDRRSYGEANTDGDIYYKKPPIPLWRVAVLLAPTQVDYGGTTLLNRTSIGEDVLCLVLPTPTRFRAKEKELSVSQARPSSRH